MWRTCVLVTVSALAALIHSNLAWAVINGNSLALKSGVVSGTSVLLGNDGYAGTYINVTSPGDVTVTVNASGTVVTPGDTLHMNIDLADTKAGFDFDPIAAPAGNYSHTFQNLPVGTYFIRFEDTSFSIHYS